MNGKHFVGRRVSSLEFYDDIGSVTGVALLLDDNNEILSGNESGYVLEITCPYGTQAMANNILNAIQSKTYRGFRAQGAVLDPLAELGDGITIDGKYSVLAHRAIEFGAGHLSEIAAPGEHTLEHEFRYESPAQRELARKIAGTRSLISKTAEEISLLVETTGDLEDSIAKLAVTVDSIDLSVSNGTSSSTISLKKDGVVVASKTIRFTGGVVFESDLAEGNTVIDGSCIQTGTIDSDYIKLHGELTVHDYDGEATGSLGYIEGRDKDGDITYGIGIMASPSRGQCYVTGSGARMGYGSSTGVTCTSKNVSISSVNGYIYFNVGEHEFSFGSYGLAWIDDNGDVKYAKFE